jgi:WD40 repeat protein
MQCARRIVVALCLTAFGGGGIATGQPALHKHRSSSGQIDIPKDQLNPDFAYRSFYTISHSKNFFAAGGADGWIYTWELTKDKQPKFHLALKGHTGAILSTAFSSNQTYLLSGGDDQTLRLWDVKKARLLHTITTKDSPTAIAFHPSKPLTYAAVVGEDEVTIFDNERATFAFKTGTTNLRSVAWSPDGEFLAVAGERGIAIWDVQAAQMARRISIDEGVTPKSILLLQDHKLFAMAGRSAYFWQDFLTSDATTINLPVSAVSAAAISDDRLAVGCTDGKIRIVSFSHDWVLAVKPAYQSAVESLDYISSLRLLISGSYSDSLRTWVLEE